MNYFISDLHLFHENCLAFDNRPFKNIDEMHKAIIERWNCAVGPYDDVYFLGDLSFAGYEKTNEVLKDLEGNKHWILGNHDKKLLKSGIKNHFVEICEYKELFIDTNKSIVLCHYPIPTFKNMYRGWYHLYGHVHTGFEWNMTEHQKSLLKELYSKEKNIPAPDVCNMYNVGAMVPYMDYTPRTLDEIIKASK